MIGLCPVAPRAGKNSFLMSVTNQLGTLNRPLSHLLGHGLCCFLTWNSISAPSCLPNQVFIVLQDLAQTFSPPLVGVPRSPGREGARAPFLATGRDAALSFFTEAIRERNFV